MVPTVTDRLASVLRALEDFIIPALPPGEALAVEQAYLSRLHVKALAEQIEAYPAAEFAELQAAEALAGQLGIAIPRRETRSSDEAPLDTATMRALRGSILGDIDDLIESAAKTGDIGHWQSIRDTVIAYQRRRLPEETKWFAGFGFG